MAIFLDVLTAILVPLIGGIVALVTGLSFELGRLLLNKDRRRGLRHRTLKESIQSMLS